MWRLTGFLTRKDFFDRSQFMAGAEALCMDMAAHDLAPARTVLNLPMDPLPADLAQAFGDRFDAVLELWFDDPENAKRTIAAFGQDMELRATADAAIDAGASHAWLAEVVTQVPPPDRHFKFVVAGQVADGLTVDEAQAYWRNEHPRIFMSVDDFMDYIVGYTQMHGRDVLEAGEIDWLARTDFYPMCADMGLRSAEEVATAYSLPSYLAIVRPDEEKFSKPADMLSFASAERITF